MMRLPIPAVLAALVAVAAGSVLLNVYFKSSEPYVIDVSDLVQRGQNKTIVLDYIPYSIKFVSNVWGWYEVEIYVNGTLNVMHIEPWRGYPYVCHTLCYISATNGTAVRIEPVDLRDTKIKIVVIRW
jgi:hypothetical protein